MISNSGQFQNSSILQVIKLFLCINLLEQTDTKSGYVKGPSREDLIQWVGKARREIKPEIIINAFKKANLLEDFKNISLDFQSEAEQVVKNIQETDYDNPYLDDFEQAQADQTELDYNDA